VLGRLRLGGAAGVLVALACGLFGAAVAQAHRKPTARERAAITRAAVAADGSPTQLVRVRAIVISTIAPWATAEVSVYLKSAPNDAEQVSQETFYRSNGRWLDTNSATTPERTLPKAVVEDLGLPTEPGADNRTEGIIILSVIGAGLLLALLAYRLTHPSEELDRRRDTPVPVRTERVREEHRSTALTVPCGACEGRTVMRCTSGDHTAGPSGGWTPDPHNPNGPLIFQPCRSCGGRYEWTCKVCKGTGVAPGWG
jgi:hypothetical protein